MQPNYFVCTLGQASALSNGPKRYRNINEFLDLQAQHHAFLPAVGFPIPCHSSDPWHYRVLTFGDVHQGTLVFAQRLLVALRARQGSGTIALVSHSSPEFLFTWLALMRVGFSVLLIAPQCQPAAIAHLCKSCDVTVLLHDKAHLEKAQQTERLVKEQFSGSFKSRPLPLQDGEDLFQVIKDTLGTRMPTPQPSETDVAYLHHTSGTSSGLPKPIAHTHRGALGVLPHLPKIPGIATFTTTPLYHGGIADLFRCWASNAPIWLFPGKDVPITALNIIQCLEQAQSYAQEEMYPKVQYFSSVPYVLQMMEEDPVGLVWLKQMDIVGVGGAALPAEVGNRLVQKGVNLTSRFGSAECGFLLSSYRDFEKDKEWQYLRNYNPSDLIHFEVRDDRLAELVVQPGWPHMAKQNREDGSFATADLFAAHPTLKNAWQYHSRADSQLTLITGKKFDPAPLEATIATCPQLDDALIFGDGEAFPGAILLRSEQASNLSDQELLDIVKPIVEELNLGSQDHARIPLHMLVPLPHQDQPLEKSSKGTIIRRAAESRFEEIINSAYQSKDREEPIEVKDENLSKHLTDMIQSMTAQPERLTEDMDLFSYGVDSIACMQLRSRLKRLIPNYQSDLPMSVIEDCGNIRRLTECILRKRRGESDVNDEDEDQLMLDLVKQFGLFGRNSAAPQINAHENQGQSEVIVLTGATGALGVHILDLLGKSTKVSKIYCLVRGANEHAATERVSKALQQRGLVDLTWSSADPKKIHIIQAQLNHDHLGLSDDIYTCLANTSTSIIHVAWTVNFRLKLRSFVDDNIAGVRNLLNLALAMPRSHPPRFTYCSSTASIINAQPNDKGLLSEQISPHPTAASPLGYSRSKWVAEHICASAHKQTPLHGKISIVRVGQLSGDSTSGVWNTKEAWPMMLSTASLIKCLPDLGTEPLDWLPVDVAAKALIEIAASQSVTQKAGSSDSNDVAVYHVLNPHREPTWHTMLGWLQAKSDFEIVSPRDWVERLEKCDGQDHSALKLLGLWKDAYASGVKQEGKRVEFDIARTRERVDAMRGVKPLDKEYVQRMWDWICVNMK